MIKIVSKRGNNLASQGTDSGYDLMAKGFSRIVGNKVQEETWFGGEMEGVTVAPNETILIKTGIHLQLPEPKARRTWYGKIVGAYIMEAQVRNRSGLSLKYNTYVKWGTIDNDYRGDCGVMFWNNSDVDFVIERDDRVAQLVFTTIYKPFKGVGSIMVDSLLDTEIGSGGFGSTGV